MKILNKLTIKHLKLNKKRTIVTIIGIILSTTLMVGIGLLCSTVRDLGIQIIEQESGTHHVMINLDSNKLDYISKNQNVKEYSYTSSLGFAEYEEIKYLYKPYIQVLGVTKSYFENLKIKEGKIPNNENEIVLSENFLYKNELNLKVGDTITLELGRRVTLNGQELYNSSITNEQIGEEDWIINEKITDKTEKKYTIVGICEKDKNESYESASYNAFTIGSGNKLNVYVTYKNVRNTYKYTNNIATNLGYKEISEDMFNEVSYNSDLLAMHGVTKYQNVLESMSFVICIVLSLVSIACIIVIYNSFAISVMERKKQFGLFASIGTTKKQLRYTVFFEAFIVGLIGIPLGILSAYIGIWVVVEIIKHILPFTSEFSRFGLVTYPLFIIIPVIFMIITIIISAHLPAKKASEVSPIEAIRQNDDIKITSKKIKSPKFITKLFGVEGDIAYKNIKRNKKKYRITIISLFISIVLFISFNSLITYGIGTATDFAEIPDFEYYIYTYAKSDYIDEATKTLDRIVNINGVKNYTNIKSLFLNSNDVKIKYTTDAINHDLNMLDENNTIVNIIALDKKAYENYKKQLGINENRPIILNQFQIISYSGSSRKSIKVNLYESINDFNISYYDYENETTSDKKYLIKNAYLTDINPLGLQADITALTIIVDESFYNEIFQGNNNKDNLMYIETYLNADNYDEITKIVEETNSRNVEMNYINVKEEMKLVYNIVLVIKILLYGFISLVTLTGATSVLNTINTSITLRRKEFAVLRSIGLTPKGFNKMLFFESLFFGLKSLLYGIPVGLIITLLLHLDMGNLTTFSAVLIPYQSIIISTVGVFAIVMMCQWYSSRKIKNENILDAIREENI